MHYVKVLGQLIEIRYLPIDELRLISSTDRDGDVWGYYEEVTRRVNLLDTLRGDELRRVLLHELGHVFVSLTGLGEIIPLEQEEALCTALENLYDLFKDETFVSFMQRGEEIE